MSDAPARPPVFGPDALATPANAVTVVRLLLAVPWAIAVAATGASWVLLFAGIALASSDALDGWLARRQGTTRSGAFLDPLSDKVLVLGAMWALVSRDTFAWLPVALITAREVGISAYRAAVATRGVSVPARPLAKAKTVVQFTAVFAALTPPLDEHLPGLADLALWAAAVLTVVTGVQYLMATKAPQRR